MYILSRAVAHGLALACPAALSAQGAPAIFVKMSTSQVASGATPTAATTATITAPGLGWIHSATAPVAGATRNQILRPNPSIGSNSTSVVGQYVCNSANAISFVSGANGTAPLSYQWQKSLNNVAFADIAGATSSVLSLPSVATADAGYYRVIVTNSVGSITSSVASHLVAPVIVTAPSMDVVASGSTKTVSVVADAGAGSPQAIAYVWKRDGVTIANGAPFSGATTANLIITGVTAAGTLQFTAGNYLNGFQLVQLTNPGFERVRVTIPYAGSRLFVRLRATN